MRGEKPVGEPEGDRSGVRASKVYVGMSGGVDSSLAAALLVEQGHDVTGVYLKNWTKDVSGVRCPWAEDLADAKRVAVKLNIDFKVYDFQEQYKADVVDYLVTEYENGRIPNPDIMCNRYIKFGAFLNAARAEGADYIATGHYARIFSGPRQGFTEAPRRSVMLKRAVDESKDQTYFLYRIDGSALSRVLFPVGNYTKKTVRAMAAERGLSTADKKDSQGICFVGPVGIRDFLGMYTSQKPGPIRDVDTEEVLGYHDGAAFFTVGQRHGLGVGGGAPYYVADKDTKNNIVYVTSDKGHPLLWVDHVCLSAPHWMAGRPLGGRCLVRLRHGGPLVAADLRVAAGEATIVFDTPVPVVAAGQSVVVYERDVCLGGGIAE